MSWLSRLVNVIRPNRLDSDLDDEIRFHREARAHDLEQSGLTAEESRRQAQRLFGNTRAIREASRAVKAASRLDAILKDIGFAFRLARRNKAVMAAAVCSLSLAMGACVAG